MPLPEEGAGFLKSIFALAVLAALAAVGVQTAPVYFNNHELSDYLQDRAVRAAVERPAPGVVQAEVVHYARQLGLPVEPDDVRVTSNDGAVSIEVDYAVPVNLGVRTWNLHFSPSAASAAN